MDECSSGRELERFELLYRAYVLPQLIELQPQFRLHIFVGRVPALVSVIYVDADVQLLVYDFDVEGRTEVAVDCGVYP